MHASGPVDLLKVDVEGAEARVLRSADLERWQPRVVLVEATLPHTTIPSHEEWERLVFDAGYRLALFDGVNRFYALAQEDELLRRLAVPANVSDRFLPHRLAVTLGAARSRVIVPRNRLSPAAPPATRIGVALASPMPGRTAEHVRAELRRLKSSMLAPETLESYQPESDDDFGILIDAEIGPAGEEGGERFSFTACSPSWLTDVSRGSPEAFRWERVRLVLPAWISPWSDVQSPTSVATRQARTGPTWRTSWTASCPGSSRLPVPNETRLHHRSSCWLDR